MFINACAFNMRQSAAVFVMASRIVILLGAQSPQLWRRLHLNLPGENELRQFLPKLAREMLKWRILYSEIAYTLLKCLREIILSTTSFGESICGGNLRNS